MGHMMVSLAQLIVNSITLGSYEVDPGLQLVCWWALGLHSFNGLVWAPFILLVSSTDHGLQLAHFLINNINLWSTVVDHF